MIENKKQFFRRYDKILELKDQYDDEISKYLKIYSIGWINFDSIRIKDNRIEWSVEISYHGEVETKYFSVSLDYFDNPEQYIASERELNRIAAEDEKEKERLKVIESEKEMLAKLKEKYENN